MNVCALLYLNKERFTIVTICQVVHFGLFWPQKSRCSIYMNLSKILKGLENLIDLTLYYLCTIYRHMYSPITLWDYLIVLNTCNHNCLLFNSLKSTSHKTTINIIVQVGSFENACFIIAVANNSRSASKKFQSHTCYSFHYLQPF